jgi:hypothetical protein
MSRLRRHLAAAPPCALSVLPALIMAPFIKKIPVEPVRPGAPHAGAAPGGSSPLRVARLRALCAWVVLLAAYLFVVILLGKRMDHQHRVRSGALVDCSVAMGCGQVVCS